MDEKRIPDYMAILGERVHVLRRRVRMSQAALARLAGMSPTTLSNIEQAKMRTITLEHLVALARILNASPNDLLGMDAESSTQERPVQDTTAAPPTKRQRSRKAAPVA